MSPHFFGQNIASIKIIDGISALGQFFFYSHLIFMPDIV